jgi:hypothetical protein
MTADDDISARIAEENRRQRRHDLLVAREFTEACRTGNVRAFDRCVDPLVNETVDGWRLAMKGVGRLPSVPPRIRKAFLLSGFTTRPCPGLWGTARQWPPPCAS